MSKTLFTPVPRTVRELIMEVETGNQRPNRKVYGHSHPSKKWEKGDGG